MTDNNQNEKAYVYAEAANGLTVRIPLDKYDEWKEAQDRIRRGEKVEPDPEMVNRLKALMLGEEIADFEKKSPIITQPTTRSTQIEDTSTKEQKIMNILTSKRIAAVISIFLCVALYFVLLNTAFTQKVNTYICYITEDSNEFHDIECSELRGTVAQETTVYAVQSTHVRCYCKPTDKITLTERNYLVPLLISVAVSSGAFLILTFKKK